MQGSILEILQEAADALPGVACEASAWGETLAALREELGQVYQAYEGPAPRGGESIREGLLEAMFLYYQAVERMLEAFDLGDEGAAEESLRLAEEATEKLNETELLIAEQEQSLGS